METSWSITFCHMEDCSTIISVDSCQQNWSDNTSLIRRKSLLRIAHQMFLRDGSRFVAIMWNRYSRCIRHRLGDPKDSATLANQPQNICCAHDFVIWECQTYHLYRHIFCFSLILSLCFSCCFLSFFFLFFSFFLSFFFFLFLCFFLSFFLSFFLFVVVVVLPCPSLFGRSPVGHSPQEEPLTGRSLPI